VSDELLREIISRLERIESLLDPDTARLKTLLPQISAVVRDRFFRIGDLTEDIDFDGLTPAQVGLLFKRNIGRTIGGFKLVALRRNREGRQYQVTVVDGSPAEIAKCAALKSPNGAAR
jgi:hypothetical protein